MASSLSNRVNNLSELIYRIKCKFGYGDRKCEVCGFKYKYCDCFLEYKNFKDHLIEYKRLHCSNHYQPKFDEKLKEQFFNAYRFPNHDNNKFILCWEKVFILMNSWMIGNNSMKHHYLKKKIFAVT